jgi:hypothetical protein
MRANYTGGPGMGAILIAATFFPVSQGFNWVWETDLIFTVLGSPGTWIASSRLNISQPTVGNLPGTPASNAMGCASTGQGTALDTTVLNHWALYCSWASTTGAPTITCAGSSFERIGQQ